MNILSLNINGLGKGEYKGNWIKNLITKHNLSIVGIQESKRRDISDMLARNIWGGSDFDFAFQGSLGKSGGIMTLWNKDKFQKSNCILRQDCLVVKGIWTETRKAMYIVNIYASQSREKRIELWSFLSALLCRWTGHTIIFGDFNEVREEKER